MIPGEIRTLFQFIEYLHSNIDNFNQYNDLAKELEGLIKERAGLSPESNYKDKAQYNKVQVELETKFDKLQDNTANLIRAKAKELDIWRFEDDPICRFDGIRNDIHELKENFSNEDLPEIFKHKNLYFEYRISTHKTFLSLEMFFEGLDKLTESLFDYFKDTTENEFEAFETKAIPVKDVEELDKLLKKGHKKFTLPHPFLNPSTIQQQTNKKTPQTLKECFTSIDSYNKALQLLRNTRPCIIDNDNNYKAGERNKSAISEWVRYIHDNPEYCFSQPSKKILVQLLNNDIKGLDMGNDGRTLDNTNAQYSKKIRAAAG